MRILNIIIVAAACMLLLAIGVPALLAGRESARRNSCGHNLSQIGTALQKYADVEGTLPPIARGTQLGMWIPSELGDDVTEPTAENWVMLLLPYLDEDGIANAIEVRDRDPFDISRFKVPFPRFRCPSDTYNRADNLYLGHYSRGNYAIDAGSNDICFQPGDRDQICPNGAHMTKDKDGKRTWYGDGIAGYNKAFRLDDFPNGSSHMVAVEEIRAGIHEHDSRGVWALGMAGASVTHQHGLYGDDGSPNNSSPNADDIYGCGDTTKTLGGQHMIDANMPCAAHIGRPRQATARSMHPGGVHCLMLDGSCRFVVNVVSVDVWHLMHSRENPQEFVLP